jgi:hypothetical protein
MKAQSSPKFAKMVKYVISVFHKFPYIIDDGWNLSIDGLLRDDG